MKHHNTQGFLICSVIFVSKGNHFDVYFYDAEMFGQMGLSKQGRCRSDVTECKLSGILLAVSDTLKHHNMNMFKYFWDKYGKELKYKNIYGKISASQTHI